MIDLDTIPGHERTERPLVHLRESIVILDERPSVRGLRLGHKAGPCRGSWSYHCERISASSEVATPVKMVEDIVPPISLGSSLATHPGSKTEEAQDVSEYGRAGPHGQLRKAEVVLRLLRGEDIGEVSGGG